MSHENKIDLYRQYSNEIKRMESYGRSKHRDKKDNATKDKIYSYGTAKAYTKECHRYVDWLKDRGHDVRRMTIDEARTHVSEYIQEHNSDPDHWSASSVKLQAAALSKVYHTTSAEWGATRARVREDITRSRMHYVESEKTGKMILNQSARAGHFSERTHSDLVAVEQAIGLRRAELTALRNESDTIVYQDGIAYVKIDSGTKGGKTRVAEIAGDPEHVQAVIDRIQSVPQGERVFERVPAAMDVHYYRRWYASALYSQYARPVDQIPRADRYYCRGDKQGVIYDRQAMKRVTESLGHNRISVIASNYLD